MSSSLNNRERFGMLLVGIARRWRAALDASLSHQGLSDATWGPLIHIDRAGGGISQKDLAARVGLDTSTLVRSIDILAGKGLVKRRQDPADRRSNRLFLTPEGKVAVKNIQRSLTEIESVLLADLNDDEMATLLSALGRIDERVTAFCHDSKEG